MYDITAGLPAAVNSVGQIGLSVEDADDLADLLNRLHTEQSTAGAY